MNPADLARPEIRALKPYASARTQAGAGGILLNANENPFPNGDEGASALNRYPDPQPPELIRRLAGFYGVRTDQVLITRGSDEGIDLLTRAFCRPDSDRVLVCPPCFGMYAMSAHIAGARVVEVPLIDHGETFELDAAGIARAPACRLYFLCSPNNPTGNRIEAATVTELSAEVAGHGLVVLDEAYQEFQDRPSLAAAVDSHPNLVVLRTLSKAFALAGGRIGAVIANPEVIELLRRIIPPYPVPTPSASAALRVLSPPGLARLGRQLKRLAGEKTRLVQALREHPYISQIWPGEANFVLVRAANGPGLVAAAAAAGIQLRCQSAQPGLFNAVRISVGAPEENDQFIKFLRGWQP